MRIVGIGILGLAVCALVLVWTSLLPYITGLLPDNEWKPFLSMAIYFFAGAKLTLICLVVALKSLLTAITGESE